MQSAGRPLSTLPASPASSRHRALARVGSAVRRSEAGLVNLLQELQVLPVRGGAALFAAISFIRTRSALLAM